MQVQIREVNNGVVLDVIGRLDVYSCDQLKVLWHDLERVRYIILNLSYTEFIDSIGLATLVTGLKLARARGGDLLLVNPSEATRIVLELTAMARVFTLKASVDEALAALEAS